MAYSEGAGGQGEVKIGVYETKLKWLDSDFFFKY